MSAPWLDAINLALRERALSNWEAGDSERFLGLADNTHGLEFVFHNWRAEGSG